MEYKPTHYGRRVDGVAQLTLAEKLRLLMGKPVVVRMGLHIPKEEMQEPSITAQQAEIRVNLELN